MAKEPVSGELVVLFNHYAEEPELGTDWGFSAAVRLGDETILFDTGKEGDILLDNMRKLGISPREIDAVFISHIHYDHIGGLEDFLRENPDVRVFVPASFPRQVVEKIEATGAECVRVAAPMEIFPGVWSTGEMGGAIMEQAMVINADSGVVVITGCAHPGIVSIVERAHAIFPTRPIYLVIGGFHLIATPLTDFSRIVERFEQLGVKKVSPTHCSGDQARNLFQKRYGENYIPGGVGTVIKF